MSSAEQSTICGNFLVMLTNTRYCGDFYICLTILNIDCYLIVAIDNFSTLTSGFLLVNHFIFNSTFKNKFGAAIANKQSKEKTYRRSSIDRDWKPDTSGERSSTPKHPFLADAPRLLSPCTPWYLPSELLCVKVNPHGDSSVRVSRRRRWATGRFSPAPWPPPGEAETGRRRSGCPTV